ncbi:MAG: CotH kinase family protein, partial [Candidatus Cloacimonadota bacterium]|nr:CotH kinase family protein [Candidatus Cloacimonadota bacterium]
MKKIVVFILLIVMSSLFAQELTLPTYYVEMDPADLETLIDNPQDDTYFEAVFTFEETVYNCEIRFRGASSLDLYPQKPSWKVRFADNNNIFDAEKINLNAEYSDRSLMRNYVIMKLYQQRGYISSDVAFRNLFVNGEYQGLLIQIENVDEDYLSHNNFAPNHLYKAMNHGANTAPLTHQRSWTRAWEKKIGNEGDYTDLQGLINKIFYLTDEDFANEIEQLVDVNNILNYFATEFAIVSKD